MEDNSTEKNVIIGNEPITGNEPVDGNGSGFTKKIKGFLLFVARFVGVVVLGYGSSFVLNVLFGTMLTSLMRFFPLVLFRAFAPERVLTQRIVPEFWFFKDLADGWFGVSLYFMITFFVGTMVFMLLIELSKFIVWIIDKSKFLTVILCLFYVQAFVLFVIQIFFSNFFQEQGIPTGFFFYVVACFHLYMMGYFFVVTILSALKGIYIC